MILPVWLSQASIQRSSCCACPQGWKDPETEPEALSGWKQEKASRGWHKTCGKDTRWVETALYVPKHRKTTRHCCVSAWSCLYPTSSDTSRVGCLFFHFDNRVPCNPGWPLAHYIAKASLGLWLSSCFPSAGIIGAYHHAWLLLSVPVLIITFLFDL